jgi:hypothetical protein
VPPPEVFPPDAQSGTGYAGPAATWIYCGARPDLSAGSLLERDAELAAITDAIGEASEAAKGCTLLIEGPAGIGKTSLLSAAFETARRRGIQVLRAHGSELEHEFAFGVARQLLERKVAELDAQARERVLDGAARAAAPIVDTGNLPGLDTPAYRAREPCGAPAVTTPAAHSTPAAREQAAMPRFPLARNRRANTKHTATMAMNAAVPEIMCRTLCQLENALPSGVVPGG